MSEFLSITLNRKQIFSQFADALGQFLEHHVERRINSLLRVRNIDVNSDRQVLLDTLHQMGLVLDQTVLDRFSVPDLYVLILDYRDFGQTCATSRFDKMMSRVLKTPVTVHKLWSRQYLSVSKTVYTDAADILLDDTIWPWTNLIIRSGGSRLLSTQYVVDGNKITVLPQFIGKWLHIEYNDFVQQLPVDATTIDDGGHWFLTNHVQLNIDLSKLQYLMAAGKNPLNIVLDLFYKLAPVNLVPHINENVVDTFMDIGPIYMSSSIRQTVLQKV